MQDALLEKLRAAVGPANVLTGVELSPFVVEGRTPEAAVFPGSVEEVAAVVGLAAEAALPVTPWGGGTAASVGMPAARAGLVLGFSRLNRLVEHEPGDLTATVEAGMTVAALQSALRSRGQWLSLDPPDAERATVGGVLAANAAGPRRHLYGTARDLLIGVTVVTADGAVVKGGGKVVKNVAGYDLPKLFIGSYGTLGIIVEATVKLRPLPDDERLVCVGFDGLPEQVEWQCAELARLAATCGGREARPLPQDVWPRLATAARGAFGTVTAVMTFSVLPTEVAELMEHGAEIARARGIQSAWTAHAGVGQVSAALLSDGEPQEPGPVAAVLSEWRTMARTGGGHATLEWAPLAVKSQVPVWDDPGAAGRIMQRIKAQLDPNNLLNPGRFVAGI